MEKSSYRILRVLANARKDWNNNGALSPQGRRVSFT